MSIRRQSWIIIPISLILIILNTGTAGGWSVRRRKGTESWENRVVQAIDDSLLRRGDSRAAAFLVAGGQ